VTNQGARRHKKVGLFLKTVECVKKTDFILHDFLFDFDTAGFSRVKKYELIATLFFLFASTRRK